ncbi:hypothetical protein A2U10_10195 [Fusobacterium necrophorum subsp. funduliforme]|uniref:Septum formation initiator n=6 Tax=Fusobacterium necrophorum TaxID=859 RepID=A0A4Q2L4B8_9FUSO|nr:hypothetical protein [Fusobacterium necrophorum]EHO19058.1 hypothetical protein HMPREF9466_01850 [Fusobacterium necrophorum subsp. funduliforme 1_1_36S]AVQ21269.1 hypothetical protein C4N15_06300 [Fusobacterium necrophorum subsp. funduliforme]AYV92963.1 hypothetical protein BSQ88_04460 [Fusobacterium necrophorum subsp. funduliforme]AYV95089.1 hypothetical protein BWX37_05420 [Fusobacterium necrophorum subsp. funduliforme]AYZ74619.1 hypothetical protein EGX98_11670 [Fusobacterium necrophorum
MKKAFILMGVIVGIIWGIHGYFLMQIMSLEQELHDKKTELDNNIKLLNRKVMEYDKKLDLAAIKKNMEEKKGMVMAEEIKYFEVSE